MTLAKCGTYAGQYQCEGWVENQKLTPSVDYPSLRYLLSTTGRECNTEGPIEDLNETFQRQHSRRVCPPSLVSDERVSESYSKRKSMYRYEGSTCPLTKASLRRLGSRCFWGALVNYISKFGVFFILRLKLNRFQPFCFL